MTLAAWLGLWLCLASLAVIAVELAVALTWALRVRRRWLAFEDVMDAEGGNVAAELLRMQALAEERNSILSPYAALLRNPLVRMFLTVYRDRGSL